MIEPTLPNFAERFWQKVDRRDNNQCWEWSAYRDPNGYGHLGIGNKQVKLAHRVAFTLANGPIPGGLDVLHECDNPPCCNPAHLRAGTHQDNMGDAKRRRRFPRGFDKRNNGAKITPDIAHEIRCGLLFGVRQKDVAELFGLKQAAVSMIARGVSWTSPGST